MKNILKQVLPLVGPLLSNIKLFKKRDPSAPTLPPLNGEVNGSLLYRLFFVWAIIVTLIIAVDYNVISWEEVEEIFKIILPYAQD